jgi:metal-responsive CopG/Arc/MetJ family transcriptional regulator
MTEQQTQRFDMRVSDEFLKRVDDWRRVQTDLPSRAEAVRRLVLQALDQADKSPD